VLADLGRDDILAPQVRARVLLADREDLAPDLVALLVLALPVELGVPGMASVVL